LLPQTIRARSLDFDYAVGYFVPWKSALAETIGSAGAPVRCFDARSNAAVMAAVGRVACWLRDEEADVVHAHLPLAGVVARLAGRLAGVPVVYTEHNLQERYHSLTRLLNALTWGWQVRVVAVSGEVAGSISRHLGNRVPVEIVRNGIEIRRSATSEEVASVRRQFDLPAGSPIVGTVAVLRAQKRLDVWLDAAKQIAEALPDVRFLIVGDGPLRAELERQARHHGLAASIRFVGLQADVQPFLALLDIFLISSEFEGLPLALLEAMAAHVPVVATTVGGIPEAMKDRQDGILVPFGEPQALAEAVIQLLEHPALRQEIATSAHRRVVRDFSIHRMAHHLEEIYREVIQDAQ